MIWPAWIAIAAVAVLLSWRDEPRPALAILGGLLVMRLVDLVPYPWGMVAAAFLWVEIGWVIATRFHANLCAALVVASGLCYVWAVGGGYPVAPGSLPFVASDALGFLAILVAGGGYGIGRFLDRRRRGWGNRVARDMVSGEEGAR